MRLTPSPISSASVISTITWATACDGTGFARQRFVGTASLARDTRFAGDRVSRFVVTGLFLGDGGLWPVAGGHLYYPDRTLGNKGSWHKGTRYVTRGDNHGAADMREFTRFVIGVAEFFQVMGIIGMTIGGGIIGHNFATIIAFQDPYGQRDGIIGLGTVIGIVVGFSIAATVAAVLFVLSELLASASSIERLLNDKLDGIARKRGQGNQPRVGAQPVSPEPRTERGLITDFSNIKVWQIRHGEVLTESSIQTVLKASAAGWAVEYWPDSNLMFLRGRTSISAENNRGIERALRQILEP